MKYILSFNRVDLPVSH